MWTFCALAELVPGMPDCTVSRVYTEARISDAGALSLAVAVATAAAAGPRMVAAGLAAALWVVMALAQFSRLCQAAKTQETDKPIP